MSIPTAAFLDTSIFDGQNYNYESTALATFVPACVARSEAHRIGAPAQKAVGKIGCGRSQPRSCDQ